MKIIAINGSPRKNGNTSKLIESALEGAKSSGAETEHIRLYDMDFKGCLSCFACKRTAGNSYGKCSRKDELTPVLDRIEKADGIIIASPIYFGALTGEMRKFIERFLFPYMTYTNPIQSVFKGKLKAACIYTMNIPEDIYNISPLKQQIETTEGAIRRLLGDVVSYGSYFTNQLESYDGVEYTYFDINEKLKHRDEQFPVDLRNVFEIGKNLASV